MRHLQDATSAYDLTAGYGRNWRQALLSDHVGIAEELGYRVVTLSASRRLVCEDGYTFPVVCSEFIEVRDEDGYPVSGRCGIVAGLDGFCDGHREEHAGWVAQTEAERAQWERHLESIGA